MKELALGEYTMPVVGMMTLSLKAARVSDPRPPVFGWFNGGSEPWTAQDRAKWPNGQKLHWGDINV